MSGGPANPERLLLALDEGLDHKVQLVHLFPESEVFLRRDWAEHIIPINWGGNRLNFGRSQVTHDGPHTDWGKLDVTHPPPHNKVRLLPECSRRRAGAREKIG
ncbi:MAG TPA: hypothetical protein P5525_15350 [Candidatus Paceibacterota bacterium]|nr:hypothetical protein [Candidatus Paceibacterota bacterium]